MFEHKPAQRLHVTDPAGHRVVHKEGTKRLVIVFRFSAVAVCS